MSCYVVGIKVYYEMGCFVVGCKGVLWLVMNIWGVWRGDEGVFVVIDYYLVIND